MRTAWNWAINVFAVIGLVVTVYLAVVGLFSWVPEPQADITLCEKGKCQQFNIRERTERR